MAIFACDMFVKYKYVCLCIAAALVQDLNKSQIMGKML